MKTNKQQRRRVVRKTTVNQKKKSFNPMILVYVIFMGALIGFGINYEMQQEKKRQAMMNSMDLADAVELEMEE